MFFTIENRTDKEVGNVFPQVSCESLDLAHTIRYDEFSNFETNLIFTLQPKAKLTDVLSQAAISASGFLINEKIKNILSNFNLIEHKYYNCIIRDRAGKVHNYYWLHLFQKLYTYIDYNNSSFFWTKSTFKKDKIELLSYDDYLDKKKQNGLLWDVEAEKLSLNQSMFNFDLIGSLPFNNGIYISKKLKEEIINHSISGVQIEEALFFG